MTKERAEIKEQEEAGMKFLMKEYKKKEEIVAKLEALGWEAVDILYSSFCSSGGGCGRQCNDCRWRRGGSNGEIVDEAIAEVAKIASGGNNAANEQTPANNQSVQVAAKVQLNLTAATKAAKAAQVRVARKARLLD